MKYEFEITVCLERYEMVQALTGCWLVEATLNGRELTDVPSFADITFLIHANLKSYGESILTMDRLFNPDRSVRKRKASQWARRVMRYYSEQLAKVASDDVKEGGAA